MIQVKEEYIKELENSVVILTEITKLLIKSSNITKETVESLLQDKSSTKRTEDIQSKINYLFNGV